MQINSKYDTLNFNSRVTFFTMMQNHFSKAGRHANQEIAEIQANNPLVKINQEKIGDKIELSYTKSSATESIREKFIYSKDGIEENTTYQTKFLDSKKQFSLVHIIKRFFKKQFSITPSEEFETQTIVNNFTNKIEETATKHSKTNNPTKISVTSFYNRKSSFPKTPIAQNMHKAHVQKTLDKNGNITFTEG